MLTNQGFADFDRLRHRSPSPMSSSNLTGGTGLPGWNNLQHEVNSSHTFIYFDNVKILSPTVSLMLWIVMLQVF